MKFFSLRSLIFLCYFVFIPILSYATITAISNGYRVTSDNTEHAINQFTTCKKVKNNGGHEIFIPVKTSAEWTNFYTHPPTGVTISLCSFVSCKDIVDSGASTGNGIYQIDPDGAGANSAFNVYCNMTVDGGGWTLASVFRSDLHDAMTIFYNDNPQAKAPLTNSTTGLTSLDTTDSYVTQKRLYANLTFTETLSACGSVSNLLIASYVIYPKINEEWDASIYRTYGYGRWDFTITKVSWTTDISSIKLFYKEDCEVPCDPNTPGAQYNLGIGGTNYNYVYYKAVGGLGGYGYDHTQDRHVSGGGCKDDSNNSVAGNTVGWVFVR